MLFQKLYSLLSEELWMKTFGRSKLKKIQELIKSNKCSSVLEVGCAEGYILRNLDISKGVGVDIRKNKLKKARLKSKNLSFKYANAVNLPFKSKSFDAVIVPDILEHLKSEDVPKAIKEAERVSKKLVIITVPQINNFNYWVLLEPDHLRCLLKYHNFWVYKKKFGKYLGKFSYTNFYQK